MNKMQSGDKAALLFRTAVHVEGTLYKIKYSGKVKIYGASWICIDIEVNIFMQMFYVQTMNRIIVKIKLYILLY